MKNTKILRLIVVLITISLIVLLSETRVMAKSNLETKIEKVQVTNEYNEWLKLTDEEKAKTLQPRKYKIKSNSNFSNTNNIFKMARMLKASTDTRYSLKDKIKDNVQIENQGNTNSCWAFATLGALESNLAMKDYKNNTTDKIYDFSERHMIYSSVRSAFLNGAVNEKGFDRMPNEGGNNFVAEAYLTNGSGAINETELPFEDSENNIDISTIQNKTPKTTIYDTNYFETPTTETEKTAFITKMKEFISNYGGLYAGIHGANILNSKYYNNDTGAIFCNSSDENAQMDHAVLIIGWDDNYDANNFNSQNRPTNKGAWIVKNTWGTKQEITLSEMKEIIFNTFPEQMEQAGCTVSSDIPDQVAKDTFIENGYTIEGDKAIKKIGDNGYMYVSYEDKFVYDTVYGIQKSTTTKDYLKVYQNDVLGPTSAIELTEVNNKYYLANKFKRDTDQQEYIDRVSIVTLEDYNNCKVYINPNSDSKAKADLKEVELKSGDTVNVKPGYHVLEFEKPVKVTGQSFVIVIEVGANSSHVVTLESKGEKCESAVINEDESYCTTDEKFETNEWTDMATVEETALRGNFNIKAYTTTNTNIENNTQGNIPSDEVNKGNQGEEQNTGNEEENNPTFSNFDSAKAYIVSVNINTNGNEEEYKMTINVSNIKIPDEGSSNKYYYAITDKNSKDIEDENWIEISSNGIKKQSDGTYSIDLEIDMDKLNNFEQIVNSEDLYLAIKEVAVVNGEEVGKVNTLKLLLPSDLEEDLDYEDGKIVATSSIKAQDPSKDTTIANKILPNTGTISIIVSIIAITIIGAFSYFRYKNIDK